MRASTLPDGITAPVASGFSIQERRKWTSSSKRSGRFSTRATDCGRIVTTSLRRTLPPMLHGYSPQRGGSRSCSRAPSAICHTVDELFDLVKESGRLRLRCTRRKLLEFAEQIALLLGQVLRRFDR